MWEISCSSLLNISVTGLVCFIGLIILLRIAGKRTLTKMNAFDFIMTLTIGSTLATTITSADTTIPEGMAALALIIGIQFFIAWLEVRFDWFQNLVKAKPTILFKEGTFCTKAMRYERITKDEILAAIRLEGMADPSLVRFVLIETNGRLSVISYADNTQGIAALGNVQEIN